MKIFFQDWCTVIPDNGSMDTEVGIFVEDNLYNARYLVLHINQFDDVYDEDGTKIEMPQFNIFVIQEQCESEEPVIVVDSDELIFTSNPDFARVNITSNTA